MNPLLFLAIVVAGIAGFCWLVAHYTDDTVTVQTEPRTTFDATELCHHADCPREYQHDTAGWRAWHLHYYERIGAAS